jgi:DNA-directed RNA polymerase specialized sigma subunit
MKAVVKLEPEYKDLYDSWKQAPDPANTGALLRALDPVFDNAIRAYAPDMRGSPTIKSKARQLAIGAFGSYDPKRGSLRSHMLTQLQRLRRVAGQSRQIIQMPEQVARDQMHLHTTTQQLHEKLGRPPSDKELADRTGLSLRRLEHIRRGVQPVPEGLVQRNLSSEEGDEFAPTVMGQTKDYTADLEFIYDDLGPTDQFIMENVLGMHGRKQITPSQVARKLGVSPASISHRTAGIQAKLDELASYGGL